MKEILVPSTLDGSIEPSFFYSPTGADKVPLVVSLHTWSADRHIQADAMLPFLGKWGFAVLIPEFRGPNLLTNPRAQEACGSKLAKQDVLDAVHFVIREYPDTVDPENIFLLGGSGGGHMSLLLSAFAPSLWKAVSSWCPIADIARWHGENKNYSTHIEACCGGSPDDGNEKVMEEYRSRSPLSHIGGIAQATLYLNHGRWDPSVPFSHSNDLFQKITAKHPMAKIYLNLFNGGHDLYTEEAMTLFRKLSMDAPDDDRELTR